MTAPAIILPRRRVLWSGGFDSTAYVLELARRGERLELLYAPTAGWYAEAWQKFRREQDAIARVLHAVPASFGLYTPERIPYDDQLYRVFLGEWLECSERAAGEWFSGQAPMLAAVARFFPGLEAGYLADDETHRGAVAPVLERAGLVLPLARTRKRELLEHAKRRGFADVLALTWSCEANDADAVDGPCGNCLPCRSRIIPAIARTK